MRRANTFEVRPLSRRGRLAFIELLDSSAVCYNAINYERRQAFLDKKDETDSNATVSELKTAVRNAVTQEEYRQRYIQQLSSSIPQQLERKSWRTWKGFFKLLEKYRDPGDEEVTDRPGLPGYWKEDGKRRLYTIIRNDTYTLEFGERSRLEIPLGTKLKEKYGFGYNEKLRLEVRGQPHWKGPDGHIEIRYDRDVETFTAKQSVGRDDSPPVRRFQTYSRTLAATRGEADGVMAAVDIGANNLAAVVTENGDHRVYHGRPCFQRYHRITKKIAELQSFLGDDEYSSSQIRRLYNRRDMQRDHAMDALVQDLAEWLLDRNVATLYVGRLDDVREEHWSAIVNEKTHLFWAHGRFRRRLRKVLEDEYGIDVCEESEAGTSSQCPECGEGEVNRSGDLFQCLSCGLEAHADVVGAVNFLEMQADECGPMARPAAQGQNSLRDATACLEWDDHRWQRRDRSTKEEPVNRSTPSRKNLASGGIT